MKIAAAMTLYNPTPEFIDNAIRTAKNFSILIICDNSAVNETYQARLKDIKNIIYMWDGKNHGLPSAFNAMMDIAIANQVDYLCTLDQDSILSKEGVEKIIQYIQSRDMSTIGIVAPLPSRVDANPKIGEQNVEWVICSGCFLNLKLLGENGIKYDAAYFVDRFDVDICTQVRNCGLKIIRLNHVYMEHMCGDNGKHSVLRHFYIFRNRFYYNKKYYPFPKHILVSILQVVRHLYLIIFSEDDKLKKLKTLQLAISDYRNGKFGEIDEKTKERIC